ncbi:MAG: UDP-N-acetylmuramate dehydrogenase [Peptococcaceae bacterium]|nr:UDP-N-acetylmuramate dehydrogenase [Peptococcaceae bacterium]
MKIKEQELMRNHTTWRIGGPADRLVQPESAEELQEAIQKAKADGMPWYVIGGGSNLLVADEGITGTVIQLGGSLTGLQITDNYIVAEAGVPLPFLARKAAEHGLSGLEFAAGIPGSVGGAVVMNAGAYQGQVSNVIRQVTCCDSSGQFITLDNEECLFSYRNSRFKHDKDLVIVSVKMELVPGEKEEILEQMKKNTESRNAKQPVEYPNAGSIFKNPAGDAAGRLIELIGAKGWRQGDAMVSEKHSNFIVNLGAATCEDVLRLIERVKQAVYNETGVLLEEEILLLGREKR